MISPTLHRESACRNIGSLHLQISMEQQDTNTAKPKLWNGNYIKIWCANFMIFFSFMLLAPLLPLYLSDTFELRNFELPETVATRRSTDIYMAMNLRKSR